MSLTRTRWAAIGAAIAVTLGAGGLFVASAANDASVFYPIVPTRVLDTRPATNVGLTGKFQSLTARKLTVTGTIDTSEGAKQVVPAGATAIVFNVTAVRPSADGFVSVRPGDATGVPKTSSLNFAAGAVLGNGGTVTLPVSGANAGQVDILYKGATAGATADVVLDVTGYYAVGTGAPGPRATPVTPARRVTPGSEDSQRGTRSRAVSR